MNVHSFRRRYLGFAEYIIYFETFYGCNENLQVLSVFHFNLRLNLISRAQTMTLAWIKCNFKCLLRTYRQCLFVSTPPPPSEEVSSWAGKSHDKVNTQKPFHLHNFCFILFLFQIFIKNFYSFSYITILNKLLIKFFTAPSFF